MATDFRALAWNGTSICTAQAGAPAGFTVGNVYQVKSAAVDNLTGNVWAIVLDDNHNPRGLQLPLTGTGPFTFQ
jgi:hypothetical protein